VVSNADLAAVGTADLASTADFARTADVGETVFQTTATAGSGGNVAKVAIPAYGVVR
jgi:hypothetical protein